MKWRRCGLAMVSACHVVLGACGSSAGADEASADGEETGAVCPEDSSLSYESFGRDFMQSYCVSCHSSSLGGAARHGAPSDHDLDLLDEIQEHADHVALAAAAGPDAINTAMPPAGKRPSDEERRQLGEWLACGAP